MDYKEFHGMAKGVRQQCYQFAHSSKASEYDFHKKRDLECMCAVASMALWEASRRSCRVVMGRWRQPHKTGAHHCWVEYLDWRFDLTATQFGVISPVFVTRLENPRVRYSHGVEKRCYKDFTWGPGQSPTVGLIKQILSL